MKITETKLYKEALGPSDWDQFAQYLEQAVITGNRLLSQGGSPELQRLLQQMQQQAQVARIQGNDHGSLKTPQVQPSGPIF